MPRYPVTEAVLDYVAFQSKRVQVTSYTNLLAWTTGKTDKPFAGLEEIYGKKLVGKIVKHYEEVESGKR